MQKQQQEKEKKKKKEETNVSQKDNNNKNEENGDKKKQGNENNDNNDNNENKNQENNNKNDENQDQKNQKNNNKNDENQDQKNQENNNKNGENQDQKNQENNNKNDENTDGKDKQGKVKESNKVKKARLKKESQKSYENCINLCEKFQKYIQEEKVDIHNIIHYEDFLRYVFNKKELYKDKNPNKQQNREQKQLQELQQEQQLQQLEAQGVEQKQNEEKVSDEDLYIFFTILHRQYYSHLTRKNLLLKIQFLKHLFLDQFFEKVLDQATQNSKFRFVSQQEEYGSVNKDVITFIFSFVVLFGHIASKVLNIYNLVNVYYLYQVNESAQNMIFFIVWVICISSTYLVVYSSAVALFISKKYYDQIDLQFSTKSIFKWVMKVLFVSFIGPLYVLMIQLTEIALLILQLFSMILTQDCYTSIQEIRNDLPKNFLQITQNDYDGIIDQIKMVQIVFESTPMACFYLFILLQYFVYDVEISLDKQYEILFLSIAAALFNLLQVFNMQSVQSKHFDEQPLEYALRSINAKINWLPYYQPLYQLVEDYTKKQEDKQKLVISDNKNDNNKNNQNNNNKKEYSVVIDIYKDNQKYRCIDFKMLQIPTIPFFSNYFMNNYGQFKYQSFDFNDHTIEQLIEVVQNSNNTENVKHHQVTLHIENNVSNIDCTYLMLLYSAILKQKLIYIPFDSRIDWLQSINLYREQILTQKKKQYTYLKKQLEKKKIQSLQKKKYVTEKEKIDEELKIDEQGIFQNLVLNPILRNQENILEILLRNDKFDEFNTFVKENTDVNTKTLDGNPISILAYNIMKEKEREWEAVKDGQNEEIKEKSKLLKEKSLESFKLIFENGKLNLSDKNDQQDFIMKFIILDDTHDFLPQFEKCFKYNRDEKQLHDQFKNQVDNEMYTPLSHIFSKNKENYLAWFIYKKHSVKVQNTVEEGILKKTMIQRQHKFELVMVLQNYNQNLDLMIKKQGVYDPEFQKNNPQNSDDNNKTKKSQEQQQQNQEKQQQQGDPDQSAICFTKEQLQDVNSYNKLVSKVNDDQQEQGDNSKKQNSESIENKSSQSGDIKKYKKSNNQENEKDSTQKSFFMLLIHLFLEVFALVDQVLDIIIVINLIQENHTAWSAISILCMLSTYFVQYSPVITMFIERKSFSQSKKRINNCCKQAIGWSYITPQSIIYLFIIDVLYIVFGVTTQVFQLLIQILTFNMVKNCLNADQAIDMLFQKLFSLNKMDVSGLRALRTFSQMVFESFPQIILQIRMYSVGLEGLNQTEILISLALAFIHIIIEFTIFFLESSAVKSSGLKYAITCLNGRLNWVPLLEDNDDDEDEDEEDQYVQGDYGDQNILYKNSKHKDFNHLKSKTCKILDVQVEYQFFNQTFQILKQYVGKNPQIEKEDKLTEILIANNLSDEITFEELVNLVDISQKKAKIDLSIESQIPNITKENQEQYYVDFYKKRTQNTKSLDKERYQYWIQLMIKNNQYVLLGQFMQYYKYEKYFLDDKNMLMLYDFCLENHNLKVLEQCILHKITTNKNYQNYLPKQLIISKIIDLVYQDDINEEQIYNLLEFLTNINLTRQKLNYVYLSIMDSMYYYIKEVEEFQDKIEKEYEEQKIQEDIQKQQQKQQKQQQNNQEQQDQQKEEDQKDQLKKENKENEENKENKENEENEENKENDDNQKDQEQEDENDQGKEKQENDKYSYEKLTKEKQKKIDEIIENEKQQQQKKNKERQIEIDKQKQDLKEKRQKKFQVLQKFMYKQIQLLGENYTIQVFYGDQNQCIKIGDKFEYENKKYNEKYKTNKNLDNQSIRIKYNNENQELKYIQCFKQIRTRYKEMIENQNNKKKYNQKQLNEVKPLCKFIIDHVIKKYEDKKLDEKIKKQDEEQKKKNEDKINEQKEIEVKIQQQNDVKINEQNEDKINEQNEDKYKEQNKDKVNEEEDEEKYNNKLQGIKMQKKISNYDNVVQFLQMDNYLQKYVQITEDYRIRKKLYFEKSKLKKFEVFDRQKYFARNNEKNQFYVYEYKDIPDEAFAIKQIKIINNSKKDQLIGFNYMNDVDQSVTYIKVKADQKEYILNNEKNVDQYPNIFNQLINYQQSINSKKNKSKQKDQDKKNDQEQKDGQDKKNEQEQKDGQDKKDNQQQKYGQDEKDNQQQKDGQDEKNEQNGQDEKNEQNGQDEKNEQEGQDKKNEQEQKDVQDKKNEQEQKDVQDKKNDQKQQDGQDKQDNQGYQDDQSQKRKDRIIFFRENDLYKQQTVQNNMQNYDVQKYDQKDDDKTKTINISDNTNIPKDKNEDEEEDITPFKKDQEVQIILTFWGKLQ